MRYLGLILDGRWRFEPHFKALGPRVVGAAAALGRLLPNVGGPGARCRRLYAGVVRSMAVYGAPLWVDALSAKNKRALRAAQRVVALRAIRGYRTVSSGAAFTLAGSPPWELEAEVLTAVYKFTVARKENGEPPAPREVKDVRRRAQTEVLRRWTEDLVDVRYGSYTIDAVRPVLKEWCERREGSLTFRLVQVLSGHGCFGQYLHRVARRETTAVCHECGAAEDTAQHTLAVCPAWEEPRRTLAAAVGGGDLLLPSVVRAMLEKEGAWSAMVSFCEVVISQKENAERAREADPLADPIRQRRRGGRRGRFIRALPPP